MRARRGFEKGILRDGYGLWAVEVIWVADFAGYTGLSVPRFQAHFTPCIEIGCIRCCRWGTRCGVMCCIVRYARKESEF
jgi:hypothetical protein